MTKTQKVTFRTAYGPHNPEDYMTHPEGESLTQQQFKDDCDIHVILDRFQRTGHIDHVTKFGAKYGFADSETFYEHMQTVATANTMFEELPQRAREHFGNDPGRFLDFVDNAAPETVRTVLRDFEMLKDGAPVSPEAPAPVLETAPPEKTLEKVVDQEEP